MKILKIEADKIGDEDMVVVEVEGYPHAKPVFPADISEKDLKIKLAEWKVNQDAVDAENEARKLEPKVEPDISDLQKLEGKEI